MFWQTQQQDSVNMTQYSAVRMKEAIRIIHRIGNWKKRDYYSM